jgi:hypothetical protein
VPGAMVARQVRTASIAGTTASLGRHDAVSGSVAPEGKSFAPEGRSFAPEGQSLQWAAILERAGGREEPGGRRDR